MVYTRTYGDLWLITLNEEGHARTCNYWYLIRDSSTAHTAFTHRHHLMLWLAERGLTLTQELPTHGEYSVQRLNGAYHQALTTDVESFATLEGHHTRGLQNGDYVDTIITTDADGLRTEHKLNPNVPRTVYDYAESRELVG